MQNIIQLNGLTMYYMQLYNVILLFIIIIIAKIFHVCMIPYYAYIINGKLDQY